MERVVFKPLPFLSPSRDHLPKSNLTSRNVRAASSLEESAQLFENIKEAEGQRMSELDRKANVQLGRQLVMASNWNRALSTFRGKLKGTQWDTPSSHRISFSEFSRLLDSNKVHFMEYFNYGQAVSVILLYYEDGKQGEGNSKMDIAFRRHVIDRMPIDCWNDVWKKLHQQIVNIDIINVDVVPAEVYSTVATAVVWSMRLALSIAFYLWVANIMRPIYSKLIPCDLGKPAKAAKSHLSIVHWVHWATVEAARVADYLIMNTGMTAFGKAYYRNHSDLVPNLAAKLEALCDEYMCYSVEKCLAVLREYLPPVETITDTLLEGKEIKAAEIWDIYRKAPRIPQPIVNPIDEYGAQLYAGRWGIHGITLPARVTFAPGNVGFSTFGVGRPMEIINDESWTIIDGVWDKRVEEMKAELSSEVDEADDERPQLLMASHFL